MLVMLQCAGSAGYDSSDRWQASRKVQEGGIRVVRCQGYKNVMQVGLGKSGTSSIAAFFTKEALRYNLTCGAELTKVIAESLLRHEPPLDEARRRCPNFYISEMARMYFPEESIQLQLTDLSAIRRAALTNETLFVHCQRNTSKWVKSVLRWGNLAQRLAPSTSTTISCNYLGQRPMSTTLSRRAERLQQPQQPGRHKRPGVAQNEIGIVQWSLLARSCACGAVLVGFLCVGSIRP